MKKTLLTIPALAAMLLSAGPEAKAQEWLETFDSGIPGTWTLYNVDGLTPAAGVSYVNNAWVPRTIGSFKFIVSTSWYNPAGTADDWIVSPPFTVSAGMFLHWDEYAPDANYPDGYEVRLSTTGNAVADFTTVLYSTGAANSDGFMTKGASLAAYAGQTVRVAFRNNSNDKFLLYLDNIGAEILPATDLKLALVAPAAGDASSYGTVGTGITLQGVVQNLGSSTITNYTVKYQEGAGAPVSYTASGSIAPYGFATFTHSVPYSIPSTGAHNLKVWVEAAGDAAHTNDTLATTITGVGFMPAKRILAEEATGTWCVWCTRGIIYMDSIHNAHGDKFSLVAVHNDDPMMVPAYDTYIGNYIGGYPSMVIDRDYEADPMYLFDIYNADKDKFAFASINFSTSTVTATSVQLPVTVTPAVDLSGDYRLAMVLTEDDVQGTGSGWAQGNAYSGSATPMHNAEFNFNTLPNPVPASIMKYDFVARSINPSPDGAPGSLPATMTAGSNYNYTFNAPLNSGWNVSKMRAVVMLIRNSDGVVLNTNTTGMALGVNDIAGNINNVSVYPNPARTQAQVKLELKEAAPVVITVSDAMGRVVYTHNNGNTAAGENFFTIPTANFAAGIYSVQVKTGTNSTVKQLSVVK